MHPILVSSPLQGLTDFRFRNAHHRFFGGIDHYYAPYIRLFGKVEIKPNYERDLIAKNNENLDLIPQIMTNDAQEFIYVANYVKQLGYEEINWNLGCPYPMVTNKGLGCGLMDDSERIDRILDEVYQNCAIDLSIKMRLGYHENTEILKLLPVLNKYPLKHIGIHARLGKQLYKGSVDLEGFEACLAMSRHQIYYNGDISTVKEFRKLQNRFPRINHWMLGRGIIADPFLAQMIKENTLEYPENRFELFSKFHDTLFYEIEKQMGGAKQIIMKMLSFWEYFALAFSQPQKIVKRIKKTKSIEAYDEVIEEVLRQERRTNFNLNHQ